MRFRRPIIEMVIIEDVVKIVNANSKTRDKLKSIISGEASTIGDIVWSNRPNEPIITVMFLTHDRKRVDNIYLVPYQHFLLLLNYMETQSI